MRWGLSPQSSKKGKKYGNLTLEDIKTVSQTNPLSVCSLLKEEGSTDGFVFLMIKKL